MKQQLFICTCCILLLLSCKSDSGQKNNGTGQDPAATTAQPEADASGLRPVLDNRVKIFIPEGFVLMGEEMLDLKYPLKEHRPTEVYTNEGGTVNVVFNHTQSKATPEELPQCKLLFEEQFENYGYSFISSEIEEINGRDFIVMEVITPGWDTEIYNRFFITSLDGRLLMGSFNCMVEQTDEWKAVAEKVTGSVEVL